MVIDTIKFKRGTKANLERVLVGENKPKDGEPIFETDTSKLKIGDGANDYADLYYIGEGGQEQRLVYNNIYEMPSVGNANTIYVIKNGNTYIWYEGRYHTKFVNNEQFYALITDENGNIVGAERQINAGNAAANYNIADFEYQPPVVPTTTTKRKKN